jgi:hypothetical protein
MDILYIKGLNADDDDGDDGEEEEKKDLDKCGNLTLNDFLREENTRPLAPGEYQDLNKKFDMLLEMKRNGQKYNLESAQMIQEKLLRAGRIIYDRIFDD